MSRPASAAHRLTAPGVRPGDPAQPSPRPVSHPPPALRSGARSARLQAARPRSTAGLEGPASSTARLVPPASLGDQDVGAAAAAAAAAAVVRQQPLPHQRQQHPLPRTLVPSPPPRPLLCRANRGEGEGEAELPCTARCGTDDAGGVAAAADPTAPDAVHGAGRAAAQRASAAPLNAVLVLECAAAAAPPSSAHLPLVGRRRLGRLIVAGALLLSSANPAPWLVSGPGPSARAATAAATKEGEAERKAGQGAPSPGDSGERLFGFVAPEPLGGDGAAAGGPGGASSPPAARYFRTLSAAVAECPPGGVVLVAAGRYRERLLLSQPLTLRAWPKGAVVEVVWETSEPYQSTLEISAPTGPAAAATAGAAAAAGQVVVEGLTVRHSSKSVANNYGVFIRGGAPRLLDCDISSATGAGVGVEGANPQLVGCRLHGCARQGIAIFGAMALDLDVGLASDPGLLYGMTGGVVQDCDVYGNALDGVLVRSGASPDLLDNLIHNNGGVGVNLQDCSGRYERNTVYDNARGAVALSALFELDPGDLAGSNSLKGLMRKL